MKSINAKKKSTGFPPVLLVLAALLVVVVVAFTLINAGIIHIPGFNDVQGTELPENAVDIAYTNAAVSAGTPIENAIVYRTVVLDENTVIPDDAMTAADVAQYKGYVMRLDLQANMPLTLSVICPVGTEEEFNDTTREVDVDYITLQNTLEIGDYIDIRLRVNSTKNDFKMRNDIVLAKKQILGMKDKVLTLRLNEEEQLLLTAARVEMMIASKETGTSAALETTKYVDNAQNPAVITYSNPTLIALMKENKNLINNPTALYCELTGLPYPSEETVETETVEDNINLN